jgi:hypothetical protein
MLVPSIIMLQVGRSRVGRWPLKCYPMGESDCGRPHQQPVSNDSDGNHPLQTATSPDNTTFVGVEPRNKQTKADDCFVKHPDSGVRVSESDALLIRGECVSEPGTEKPRGVPCWLTWRTVSSPEFRVCGSHAGSSLLTENHSTSAELHVNPIDDAPRQQKGPPQPLLVGT